MLEMVHYILRYIITMKHVIYGPILSGGRESGGVLEAPPVGSGAEHQRKWNVMHFSLKICYLVAPIFHFPWLFPKKYFPLPFPDRSFSLTFSSFPWPTAAFTRTFIGARQLSVDALLTSSSSLCPAESRVEEQGGAGSWNFPTEDIIWLPRIQILHFSSSKWGLFSPKFCIFRKKIFWHDENFRTAQNLGEGEIASPLRASTPRAVPALSWTFDLVHCANAMHSVYHHSQNAS